MDIQQIGNLLIALDKLKRLRRQLEDRTFQWTPQSLEDWRNDVEEALITAGLQDDRKEFAAIPPGENKVAVVVRDNDVTDISTHYDDSSVQDFEKNGKGPSKQLLDSVVKRIETHTKGHEKEYREFARK